MTDSPDSPGMTEEEKRIDAELDRFLEERMAALDASIERATKEVEYSRQLLASADSESGEIARWKEEHGINGELLRRIVEALPPEQRKVFEQDEMEFEREVADDMARIEAESGEKEIRKRPRRKFL